MIKPKFVLYTTKLPSKLLDDLLLLGYDVFEAMAFSEVLHVCEHHNISAVLIGPEINHPSLPEIQQHHITVRLEPQTQVADLVWELSHLFPGTSTMMQ